LLTHTATLDLVASNFAQAIKNDQNLLAIGVTATASGPVITLSSYSTYATTYLASKSSNATETLALGSVANGTVPITISGTGSNGDQVTLNIFDENSSTNSSIGPISISAGETPFQIASSLQTAITTAAPVNIMASVPVYPASPAVLNITSTSPTATTYSITLTGSQTESFAISPTVQVVKSEHMGTFFDNQVNQLSAVKAGGPSRFEGVTDVPVKPLTIKNDTDSNNTITATMVTAQNFRGDLNVLSGDNQVEINGTAGGTGVRSDTHHIVDKAVATTTFDYDADGNMTRNGSTYYFWDAENRLTKIRYGTSENDRTELFYDGFGRCVQMTEYVGNVLQSNSKFVWDGTERCELRDASSNDSLLRQFFAAGQINFTTGLGTPYFYTFDHLGSIREMLDSTGVVKAEYSYSPFGERTVISESLPSDFGFAGMYVHAQDGLNLTMFRPYDSSQGRWLARDPLGESAGGNLYAYCGNSPTNFTDRTGLLFGGVINAGEDIGQSSMDYWAEQSLSNPLAAIPGTFAALWTPSTSDDTFSVLSAAAGSASLFKPTWGPSVRVSNLNWHPDKIQWSHALPKWMTQGRPRGFLPKWLIDSPLNGNFRSTFVHAQNDPYAAKFWRKAFGGGRWFKNTQMNPKFMQIWNRIPDWIKGLFAAGATQALKNGGNCD
jgi:RHS repeat-associated protein